MVIGQTYIQVFFQIIQLFFFKKLQVGAEEEKINASLLLSKNYFILARPNTHAIILLKN